MFLDVTLNKELEYESNLISSNLGLTGNIKLKSGLRSSLSLELRKFLADTRY